MFSHFNVMQHLCVFPVPAPPWKGAPELWKISTARPLKSHGSVLREALLALGTTTASFENPLPGLGTTAARSSSFYLIIKGGAYAPPQTADKPYPVMFRDTVLK